MIFWYYMMLERMVEQWDFNYNGKLRCKELLLKENREIKLIRRQETEEDYFANLSFQGSKYFRNLLLNLTFN